MESASRKDLNQILFEETLTRLKNAKTDADRMVARENVFAARRRLNCCAQHRHWLNTDPTIKQLMRDAEEPQVVVCANVACTETPKMEMKDLKQILFEEALIRLRDAKTDAERTVESKNVCATIKKLRHKYKYRRWLATNPTIKKLVRDVLTRSKPEVVSTETQGVSDGTTVVAHHVNGTPLPKLYIGPVGIEGPIDQIQLKQGFPEHVEYVLMCDLGVVGRTTSRNFAVTQMPGAEKMLRDVDFDLSKLPNLWIDSPDSDVCRPKDGRFFNCTYEVCFENKAGTRCTQWVHPNDMALFNMGGLNTCGIDICDPPWTFSLLQSDTDPWMQLVDPKLVGIDKERVTGLTSVDPDTPLRLTFLIVTFHGTQGMLPKKLVCTQYFKVKVIEIHQQ